MCVAQASQISCGEIDQNCFQGPGVNLPHSARSSDGRWVNLLNLQVISGWFQRFCNQNSIPAGSSQGEFTRPLQLCLGVMSRFVWEGFDTCFFPEFKAWKVWLCGWTLSDCLLLFHIHTLASQFIASSMWTIFILDNEQVEHVMDEFQIHDGRPQANSWIEHVKPSQVEMRLRRPQSLLLQWNQKASHGHAEVSYPDFSG